MFGHVDSAGVGYGEPSGADTRDTFGVRFLVLLGQGQGIHVRGDDLEVQAIYVVQQDVTMRLLPLVCLCNIKKSEAMLN